MGLNRKQIPIGSVGYYLKNKRYSSEKEIAFGIVEEHYSGEIALQLYEPFDARTINGIPVKEFETPTEYKKLPKGWSWDTHLFEYGAYIPDEIRSFMDLPATPENILDAIKAGALVEVDDNDHAVFETEIDKSLGWRIVRKYRMDEYHQNYISLPYYEVFATYEESKEKLDAINAEFARQAALTDLEWSIEQIDNNIGRWAKIYGISKEEMESVRNRIMSFDNLEDVVTRVCNGGLEWKYDRNKKWIRIEP